MLTQLLRLEKKRPGPVAWRDLDYGPTSSEEDDDYYDPRCQWNIEQVTRRALRSLERRGLVDLGQYSFPPKQVGGIRRGANGPANHLPGQDRFMTGVLLTGTGRRAAELAEARRK
jgi:hypothetical protein